MGQGVEFVYVLRYGIGRGNEFGGPQCQSYTTKPDCSAFFNRWTQCENQLFHIRRVFRRNISQSQNTSDPRLLGYLTGTCLWVSPGEEIQIPMEIRNDGNGDDRFEFVFDDSELPDGWERTGSTSHTVPRLRLLLTQ